MHDDHPIGLLKVPIGEPEQPTTGADTAPEATGEAAQAESRLQKATGDVKEAFRQSRHT